MSAAKQILMIAGPNGAGKTTFAREYLPNEDDVPEDVVRRRFIAGRMNFDKIYRPLVDAWVLYDNAGPSPVLLEWGERA